MDNRDWQKKGNDFWNVVQDAVNSGNYQQLNQQVKETIDDTVEGIRRGMQVDEWREAWRESGRAGDNRYQKSRYPAYRTGMRRKKEDEKQLPSVYVKNPPGQVAGVLMAVLGYTLTGIFGLCTLSCALVLAFRPSVPVIVVTSVMAALSLVFLGLGIAGSSLRGRVRRFRNYVRQIGSRAYCDVSELAERCGRDKAAVIKDLKKMIEKRMFLQGHLDQQETCLIVTNDMYRQYLATQQQAREMQRQREEREAKQAQMPEECQKILEEGKDYIAFIRKCNDDIPGEEISQKLSRLELIITRIFEEVGKNPALASDLRKFMSYYLPTTGKLLNAYREMDRETIVSPNIEKTKREIEDTLDTINQAFENLLNSFFEEKALDISSDISVLHTMLAQEGLTKRDFEGLNGRGGQHE